MVRRAIPKKAVKGLIEHCNKFGKKTGRSGAEVFKDYLSWMKKYADFFFNSPWPEKQIPASGVWLTDEEFEFVRGSGSYEEEVERFTLVLLMRNLSLQGFNAACFDSEYDFYGRINCGDCAVPEAMRLREYKKKLEERAKWLEERMEAEPNDHFWMRMQEHDNSPEYVKSNKMAYVELDFMEVEGEAKGKICKIRNKYLCPYGAECWKLIKVGKVVKYLWKLLEFYDNHWNISHTGTTSSSDAKWHHFSEPSILDVTNRDDILRALEDGRMDKIESEYSAYNQSKEAQRQV